MGGPKRVDHEPRVPISGGGAPPRQLALQKIRDDWQVISKHGGKYTGNVEFSGVIFATRMLTFTKEGLAWKGHQSEYPEGSGVWLDFRYGITPGTLTELTLDDGSRVFALLYRDRPDGSVEIFRSPTEHPNFKKAAEDAHKEAEVANLEAFESIMTAGPAAESRISGASRFAESAPDIARSVSALKAVNGLTTGQAEYFVQKARAEFEGPDTKIGSVPLADGSEGPIILAEVIEESFVGTGFESVKDSAANILAAKAQGLVRASIAHRRREANGESFFDIDHGGKRYRDVRLPLSALDVEGDMFIPLEYLEGFPSD